MKSTAINPLDLRAASAATAHLRPLDFDERRVVALVYHEATGAITTHEYLNIDDVPGRGAYPEGDILITNTFSPLTEAQIRELAEKSISLHHRIREAQQ